MDNIVKDKPKVDIALETGMSLNNTIKEERNIKLHIDMENPKKYGCAIMASGNSNKSLHQVLRS